MGPIGTRLLESHSAICNVPPIVCIDAICDALLGDGTDGR